MLLEKDEAVKAGLGLHFWSCSGFGRRTVLRLHAHSFLSWMTIVPKVLLEDCGIPGKKRWADILTLSAEHMKLARAMKMP